MIICPKCEGKGQYPKVISEECSDCNGSGWMGGNNSMSTTHPCHCDNGKTIDVKCEECDGTGWAVA